MNSEQFLNFTTSFMSSIVATSLLQPFDVLKTKMQTNTNPKMKEIFQKTMKKEGIKGFYKGTTVALIRNVPAITTYLFLLTNAKAALLQSNIESTRRQSLSPTSSLLLAMTIRSIVSFSFLPLTVIKTRIESGSFEYRTFLSALATIYRLERFSGLYSGLLITILRDGLFSGLYFMFYESFKTKIRLWEENQHEVSLFHVSGLTTLSSVTSGIIATLLTQPADTVRNRMQLKMNNNLNTRQTIYSLWNTNGFRTFFQGSSPRVLRRLIHTVITWTIYDQLVLWTRGH